MQRLCGDCRNWKQNHALDHIERDEDTGVLEGMHFGGMCVKYAKVTWRDDWCHKNDKDPQIVQQEIVQEAIRQAALKKAKENGPKMRWRYDRPVAPKPRNGLVIEQVMMRYGLRKNLAKAVMELAGPFKIPKGCILWCAPDALDAIVRDYRDKPAATLMQDAKAARDAKRVYFEAKEEKKNGDQDPVQKPEGG